MRFGEYRCHEVRVIFRLDIIIDNMRRIISADNFTDKPRLIGDGVLRRRRWLRVICNRRGRKPNVNPNETIDGNSCAKRLFG